MTATLQRAFFEVGTVADRNRCIPAIPRQRMRPPSGGS